MKDFFAGMISGLLDLYSAGLVGTKFVEKEHYDVVDRNTVIPYIIRRCVNKLSDAEAIAKDYLNCPGNANAKIAIVQTQTVKTVVKTLTSKSKTDIL